LSVEVEVEATAPAASTRGPAAAPSARFRGVGAFGSVVGVRHYVVRFVDMLKRFVEFVCWIVSVYCFVMVIFVPSVYVIFVMVCGTVGVLHQSRVCWRRGAVDMQGYVFLAVCHYVGSCRSGFLGTGLFTNVAFAFNFIFR
jgi:hypothetical protein